jgi:hypothetical protein
MPGIQTWFGDLVVAGGTFLVIYSGSSKKESIDATEALRPRLGVAGGEDALKPSSSATVKSSLIPPRCPALSKSPAFVRETLLGQSFGHVTAKVVWDV